ncbi:hypothetical protein D3C73_1467240 [compost metagenome]
MLVSPFIPDADPILLQVADIGVTTEKPKQLMNDRPQVNFFGGHQGDPFTQVKAQLTAKHGDDSCTSAITLLGAIFQNVLQK